MNIKTALFSMASFFMLLYASSVLAEDLPAVTKQQPYSTPAGETKVNEGDSIRVGWTVNEYKLGTDALLREEEAREFLFKPLDIDVNTAKITFNGQTCRNVIFETQQIASKEYLEKTYHTTPQAIGVRHEILEVINTNCDIPGFRQYVRLNDSRLIIYIKGIFFFFQPNINY
jgi:hypothetical protein